MTTPLPHWRLDTSRGYRLVGFGSSNTEMSWHSEGCHTWFNWLTCCTRGNMGKHITAIDTGICGDTSTGLLGRFDRDVVPLHPDLVLVTIGGNDQFQMTVEHYAANLRELVKRIRGLGAMPALQTYYCPLYGAADLARFDAYMNACCRTARETDTLLLDPYTPFRRWHVEAPAEYRPIMRDDLHLNPIGNAIFGGLCSEAMGAGAPPEWPERIRGPIEAGLRRVRQTGG